VATWIFQGNPSYYDVRGAIRSLPQLQWRATRYADKIRERDRVYLWESGDDGGIVAVTTVIDRPRIRRANPDEERFTRDPRQLPGDPPKAILLIRSLVCTPLTREELRAVPQLSRLSILRYGQATNFPVTVHEATVIDQLLANRHRAPETTPPSQIPFDQL
jgi:hypothetical protein